MNTSLPETLVIASRPVRYAATAALGVLALFLLVLTWHAAFGRHEGDPLSTITVEGEGTSAAAPDIAQITYTVIESASTVASAQDSATKRSDAALDALKKLGVEDKDIKTLSYNVSPKYEYSQGCRPGAYCGAVVSSSPKIVGYDVSQTVEVKVRDTAKAGDVLQALGSLGVQNVSGPNFMVDNDDSVKAEARKQAIEEARAKAKKLAGDLGVRLGAVVSYSEGGSYPMPMYNQAYGKGGVAMDASVAAPSLPTGENESKVTVSITYEIR
jgi:uncharacterized protein YggE